MEDGSPTLEVGFAINFGDAFGQLRSLDDIIGEASANAVREFNKLEAAARGVDLAGATSSARTFGSEMTRAAQDAKQAYAQAEKAGEGLSRQLEKQIATFGLSREQIRATNVETKALAATQQGLFELGDRLRGQQQTLAAAEAAATQRKRDETEATRQATEAYRAFEAYAGQKSAAYRAQLAAEAAARTREEAEAVREASDAYRAFNAYAAQKMVTYRQQLAAQEQLATSASALRASIDPMFAAQQRFDGEMTRAEKLLAAGAISTREYTQATQMAREALQAHATAVAGDSAAAREAADAEARLNAIRMASAQQIRAGASAGAAFSAGMAGMSRTTQGAQIEFLEMTHIARNLTEQIATGVSPFRALAMESGRFMTAVQYGGAGIGGFIKQFAGLLGIIKIVQDAELAEAAANEASTAASIRSVAERARGAGVAAAAEIELALAGQRVATTEVEGVVAANRLTAGYEAQAIAAGQLIIAENALAVAEERAAEAAAASAAATSTAIGATTAVLAPLAVIAAVAFTAFKQFQSQVKDSGELTRYRDSLGLTHKEMLQLTDGVDKAEGKIKKLADVSVTAGDVMAGLWKTIQDGANVDGSWDGIKSGAATAFGYVLEAWNITSAGITAGIYGTFNVVKTVWNNFPAVFGDLFVQGVNLAIEALNKLVKAGVDQLNGLIATVNKVPGINIGQVDAPQIGLVDNANAGAAAKAAKTIGSSYQQAYADARKADAAFWSQVGANAKQRAKDRMTEEADALKADRTAKKPKVDHHAEQLARDAAAVEAQIANLYKLAAAYDVSDAAALVAEARVKAESQAIKQRADIEAAVDRQVRLAIAQRVSDAEKSAAAMRNQAVAQAAVNAEVANGNVPAERAADLVRDRMADLPLLAAIEVAQQRGLTIEAKKATDALNDQREAQAKADAARVGNFFTQADAAADKQLAQLQTELGLVSATDAVRTHTLAVLKATQEATAQGAKSGADLDGYVSKQVAIADVQEALREKQDAYNQALSFTADKWDLIARNVQAAGQGMEDAFGSAGKALGDLGSIYANYHANQARLDENHAAQLKHFNGDQAAMAKENAKFALQTSGAQVGAWADAAEAAKGFFAQGSAGYKVLQDAEMAFRAVQFVLSLRAMAQDTAETGTSIANSVARTGVKAVEAVVTAISSLPFPLNLVAGAATIAALAGIGVAIAGSFGGGHKVDPGNTGTGSVLGDSTAKSDSIKNAIDALKNVDTLTNSYSREMAASLKSIDSQISGVAAQIVKGGDAATGASVATGFKPNAIGSVLGAIPLIGGFLSSLFGSKTEVTASGLYGSGQTLGAILASGYKGQTYSDVTKTSKFFGITTGHSSSTQYGALDPGLQNQFTLILKSFDDAILAAAGPLGAATGAVQDRLNSFVVDIGKIDLKGLTGTEIEDKLNAVFGAAADSLAQAAFPEIAQFQKVGEGLFETLVRVSSTVEQVSGSLDLLGNSATGMSIAAKVALADQFDSVSDLTSAADAYFQSYYSSAEQTAAKTAQMTKVFDSLGLAMPGTLDAFRHLVEAQDLTTAAGQATYATLLKLAPAFADLQSSLTGAKSAADIASEKADLQRQLLELQGNTAAVRALDLAKIDASNRDLQQQVWATQDAQDAAKAASDLADAWKSVGDSITDEIKRIRGLTDDASGGSFAALMGQFNAATTAARGGDQDAAKSLPQLSQALLTAAADAATSRQELDRVQAQTAASLEATYGVITALAKGGTATTADAMTSAAAASAGTASAPAASNDDDLASEIAALREELAAMRTDMNAGNATIASNTGKTARILDTVTAPSGGEAVTVASAA